MVDAVPKRVLVLSFSPLAFDARVLRQVNALKDRYLVTTAAFGPSTVSGIEHIELHDLPPHRGGFISRLLYGIRFVLGDYAALHRQHPRDREALSLLGGRDWDVVIANDALSLPVATQLTGRILADLHEYSPSQGEGDEQYLVRKATTRYFRWILRRFLPHAERVTTVSRGLAELYLREFGVEVGVIENAALYRDGQPTPVGSPIRLVHSGAAGRGRQIELIIDAVRETRLSVTLDCYLIDDGTGYLEELKAYASQVNEVVIHPPVPQQELVDHLSQYDLGVMFLAPINLTYEWALPNKVFDYVQARLGLLVGPSPEMERLVREYELGAVTPDFSRDSLIRLLDELNPDDVASWKQGSHNAAGKLSGEIQIAKLGTIIDEMVNIIR